MNQKMFSSDVELGKFLGSIGVIPDAYKRALLETSPNFEPYTTPSGIQVLAFDSFANYITPFRKSQFDLVSSDIDTRLHFIRIDDNTEFSINKAAVELFDEHYDKLKELLDKHINSPLVVTGHGLGGYLAILYALLHQQAVDVEESKESKKAKRPICITFGAPLLGDEALLGAISERPQWTSCFLNVVAKTDTLASFFSRDTRYKPFGTFLFCAESGGHTAFDDQDTILAVLADMPSYNTGNDEMHDYTNELGQIRRKILYRGASELGQSNLNPLTAGIVLQFQEIGMLKDDSSKRVAKQTEDKRVTMIRKKRRDNAYEPSKKLNDMKISLTYMEWYMKSQKSKGGYYNSFGNASNKTKEEIEGQQEIIKHLRIMNQYWKKIVKDKNRMPQKEGAKLRKRWLLSGINYKRIVEPLDIAIYHKEGKTEYIKNRSNHYILLEQWFEEDKKHLEPSGPNKKPANLTEDSCFWAHVEEALILLSATNGDPSSIATKNKEFEDYIWKGINDLSLSPDVFLKGSSLITWWEDYKKNKSPPYSEFIQYMNEGRYNMYKDVRR